MEAKQNSITKFMQQQDVQFIIPVYQRNYDWRTEQCQQLLLDIYKAGQNSKVISHFIGSIVYVQMNTLVSTPILTIIDGQQRLTTITLIVIALYNRCLEVGSVKLANEIKKRYIINEFLDEDEKLKLKPIKKDDKALKFILNQPKGNFSEFSRLVENYSYFFENIKPNSIEIIYQGLQKLVFIEIGLDKDKDDPQKIFQSLNSTGLDLSQADLIRNYVLMDLPQNQQLQIYENFWTEIELNTTESNTKNSRLSDFIRDYLTFKFSKIPNQDKVFETFKEKFTFNNNIEELEHILQDIRQYANYFSIFINPDKESNDLIKENLKYIKKLQINVSYPFLLQVFDDYFTNKITENILIEVLEIVQSFVWRRFICGVATNALNKIFMDLHKDIDYKNYINSLYISLLKKKGSQRFPNNTEILKEIESKDMYYIQRKNRLYFFDMLENYGKKIKITVDNNPEVSIEHIFPQSPSRDWKKILGDDYNEMKKFLNTAANLTLSAFNKELSNKPFLEKRDLEGKGYKDSPLRIDKFLSNFDDWNLENLTKRKQWIFDRFITIWKYPDIKIENNVEIELNILDLFPEDIKYKSIEYYKFFDTVYKNTSFSKLLENVATIMFEREPHMFLATELAEKLKLTQDSSKCLRPIKISQSYYIDSNLSGAEIIKRVQLILEKCETDDDLMIKFKDNNK